MEYRLVTTKINDDKYEQVIESCKNNFIVDLFIRQNPERKIVIKQKTSEHLNDFGTSPNLHKRFSPI